MDLQLIKGSLAYQKQITEMLNEWSAHNATHQTNHSPWAIFKNSWSDFSYYLDNLDITNPTAEKVPSTTFFCLEKSKSIIVGAVNIRHRLNEKLLLNGGHIGYGVRPSCRQKGVATKMLALALEECNKLNIKRVLLVCDKSNTGSEKCILNNGGVLENEITVDGNTEKRFWIYLN